MSNKYARLVELAKRLKEDMQTGKHFHVAFLLRKNKIVEIGTNSYNKTNTVSASYVATKEHTHKPYIAGVHAEQKVLGKMKYHDSLHKHNMVVIRINNLGELANSKPCPNCAFYLGKAGLNKVIYSESNGFHELSC